MKVIKPSYEIITDLDSNRILKDIERAARSCYKSEDKITEESATDFIARLLKKGHEAMIEHSYLSVNFIVNRGFTHECVRHRLAAFAQESTRYCNYSKGKFGTELSILKPRYIDKLEVDNIEAFQVWQETMLYLEKQYIKMATKKEDGGLGISPQIARDILPIGVKAEITVSCNLREWRHIFKMRTHQTAHPIMHELMRPLCEELKTKIPVLFDEFTWE